MVATQHGYTWMTPLRDVPYFGLGLESIKVLLDTPLGVLWSDPTAVQDSLNRFGRALT